MNNEQQAKALIKEMEAGSRVCFDSTGHSDWPDYCAHCVELIILAALDRKDKRHKALVEAAREVKALKDDGYTDVQFGGFALSGLLSAFAALEVAP